MYSFSGEGNSWWKNVSIIIDDIVKVINNIFVFILKLFAAKILGIIKNIVNGLIIPPVK